MTITPIWLGKMNNNKKRPTIHYLEQDDGEITITWFDRSNSVWRGLFLSKIICPSNEWNAWTRDELNWQMIHADDSNNSHHVTQQRTTPLGVNDLQWVVSCYQEIRGKKEVSQEAKISKNVVWFVVSETFETVTSESAESGEAQESGFTFENEKYDPDELEDYLSSNGFTHSSNSGNIDRRTWITTDPLQDRAFFERGEITTKSLHLKSVIGQDGNSLSTDIADRLWAFMLNNQLDSFKAKDHLDAASSPFEPTH